MNDRYLFKAKRKMQKKFPENEHWIIWDAITGKPREAILSETICQCTGLRDKAGILIWENDIVRCIDQINDSEFYAVVKFGNPNGFYSWGYQLKHIKGDEPNLDILLWVDMEETGATIEVIGNIFDNSELLEVE